MNTVNTPKTAALWELLREMGWSEDQRPVSFIMQSHEELERELASLRDGFDADGRTAAEACCVAFKREQVERIKTLERELDQERQDRKQAELDAIRALGERNDARKKLAEARKQLADWQILQATTAHELAAEQALADRLAEQIGYIAKQELASEMDDHSSEHADWQEGYETCVKWSREALAAHKAARNETKP